LPGSRSTTTTISPAREKKFSSTLPDGGAKTTGSELLSVWHRQMELPRYLRAVEGRAALVSVLDELAGELGFQRLALISGPTVTLALASGLATELAGVGSKPLCAHDNSRQQVESLAASPELRSIDAVVAVGGGRTIDVAKLVCEQLELPVIVVPTQLTADGIASPVSVVRAHTGEIESLRARLPIGVVVDLEVVASSPVESARAGLGDLLANACAVRDWRRAAAIGRETVDDFAALLAQAASDLVSGTDVKGLASGTFDRALLQRLLQGLVLSGLAMEIAGSSRPCSGSEHLVSHAIDRLYPGTARHGEQVAFGAMLCSRLQEEDWRALKAVLVDAGMDRAVCGFGLSEQQIGEALRAAPSTRPGRYTVLDEVDLTDAGLRPVVAEVLRA
jgi:glycerol-1-phosphate dehydrogenase [NAD(P)+]